jgi:hypothetical protein
LRASSLKVPSPGFILSNSYVDLHSKSAPLFLYLSCELFVWF